MKRKEAGFLSDKLIKEGVGYSIFIIQQIESYVYIVIYIRIKEFLSIYLYNSFPERQRVKERERENRDWLNHETIYTYNIGISCRCRFIICTSTE